MVGAKGAINLAIIAGGGQLPLEVAHAAHAAGHRVLVIGLAGQAELSGLHNDIPREQINWGQIGTLQSFLDGHQTQKLVIIGGVSRRPELKEIKPDWGAVKLLPTVVTSFLTGGDSTVLDNVAQVFEERGYTLAGAHEVAPGLLAVPGQVAGPPLSARTQEDAVIAAQAAWTAGHLDMGQGAVAVGGRLVSMEGAEGTDGQLERVATMRANKRFSASPRQGVFAKCTRPQQDLRMDMPAIGPRTIENVAAAGLIAIVLEASRVLISQREQVISQCHELGISLVAQSRSAFVPPGREDQRAW